MVAGGVVFFREWFNLPETYLFFGIKIINFQFFINFSLVLYML